jgi:hypothetical protein
MVLVAAAALAVLVGVVCIVLGKGGQLARFEADHPPLALPEDRPVEAFDLGRLMLPLAMWGYHVRAVDELLLRLTATLREREERIQDLEWRLSRLDPSYVPEGTGPIPGAHLPGDAYAPEQGTWGPTGAGSTAVAGFGSGAFRPAGGTLPEDPAARDHRTTGPTEVIEDPGTAEDPRTTRDAAPSQDSEGSEDAQGPGDPAETGAGEAGGSGTADGSGGSPAGGGER